MGHYHYYKNKDSLSCTVIYEEFGSEQREIIAVTDNEEKAAVIVIACNRYENNPVYAKEYKAAADLSEVKKDMISLCNLIYAGKKKEADYFDGLEFNKRITAIYLASLDCSMSGVATVLRKIIDIVIPEPIK